MQKNFLKTSFYLIIAGVFIGVSSCSSNPTSTTRTITALKNDSVFVDSIIARQPKKQSQSFQKTIEGLWYQEGNKSQKFLFRKDSLYEITELGTNGYTYTLSDHGIIDGETINVSENDKFLSYYRGRTLQLSYVLTNITDTAISFMSPTTAQIAIYLRVK